MALSTEKVGARVYVTGDTFAYKDQLRSAGCHWDGDRRQWWIGAARAAALAPILSGTAAPAPAADNSNAPVYARATYKRKTYYVLAETDRGRVRLASLDGTLDFWADAVAVQIVKRYQPTRGRYGRGREEYQTLGGLRRFFERQRDPATRRGECTECGAYGPAGEPCPECGGEGTYV